MNRRMLTLMILVCLIFAAGADARRPAVARAPFDARRILWIGAHPDDELLIAPLLGRLCVEGRSECFMIVVTRGENGPCELPGGCTDLGSLREQEMRASAAAFHASLTQWSYPDVLTGFESAWPHDELVGNVKDAIAVIRPTVVITLDPQHGSTDHPAHKVLGAAVLEAFADADLVETGVTLSDRYHFINARPGDAIAIDARSTWHYLTEDAAIHATQFSSATLASLAATPDSERVVFIARP